VSGVLVVRTLAVPGVGAVSRMGGAALLTRQLTRWMDQLRVLRIARLRRGFRPMRVVLIPMAVRHRPGLPVSMGMVNLLRLCGVAYARHEHPDLNKPI
jgi:hypothetical protein